MQVHLKNQPTWTEFSGDWNAFYELVGAVPEGGFSKRIPIGYLVELKYDNNKVERVMVGHVNANSGQCDCCCVYGNVTVVRYLDLREVVSQFEALADVVAKGGR